MDSRVDLRAFQGKSKTEKNTFSDDGVVGKGGRLAPYNSTGTVGRPACIIEAPEIGWAKDRQMVVNNDLEE